MAISIGKVEQTEDDKIAYAIEVAYNELVRQCEKQGLKVMNLLYEGLTADGVAAEAFAVGCRGVVKRLQEIAAGR